MGHGPDGLQSLLVAHVAAHCTWPAPGPGDADHPVLNRSEHTPNVQNTQEPIWLQSVARLHGAPQGPPRTHVDEKASQRLHDVAGHTELSPGAHGVFSPHCAEGALVLHRLSTHDPQYLLRGH